MNVNRLYKSKRGFQAAVKRREKLAQVKYEQDIQLVRSLKFRTKAEREHYRDVVSIMEREKKEKFAEFKRQAEEEVAGNIRETLRVKSEGNYNIRQAAKNTERLKSQIINERINRKAVLNELIVHRETGISDEKVMSHPLYKLIRAEQNKSKRFMNNTNTTLKGASGVIHQYKFIKQDLQAASPISDYNLNLLTYYKDHQDTFLRQFLKWFYGSDSGVKFIDAHITFKILLEGEDNDEGTHKVERVFSTPTIQLAEKYIHYKRIRYGKYTDRAGITHDVNNYRYNVLLQEATEFAPASYYIEHTPSLFDILSDGGIDENTSTPGNTTYILDFSVVYKTLAQRQINPTYIYNYKAFAPSTDRKFHKYTCAGTTDSKKCIYESYLDVTGSIELKKCVKKKLKRTIGQTLRDEGPAINTAVKKGELINALQLLTAKYGTSVLLIFYGHKHAPMTIEKGIVNVTPDLSKNEYKKAFLYHRHHSHVAPMIIDLKKMDISEGLGTECEQMEDNDKPFVSRPEFLKKAGKRITNVLGFDCEAYLDTYNMSVVFNICISGSLNNSHKDPCNNPNINKKFYGVNALDEFIDYIDGIADKSDTCKTKNKNIKPIFIYGFNNSRYDNLLIYGALYNKEPCTDFTWAKNSIKKIKFHNISILDMNCYYQGALDYVHSQFFKISKDDPEYKKKKEEEENKKGYYPYEFPNKDNLYYKGPIPDLKYFNNDKDYNGCLKALDGKNFDMKEYTEKYCLMDAKLVYRIAMKHLETCIGIVKGQKCINAEDEDGNDFKELINVDRHYDVQHCATAAGTCMKIYKQGYQIYNLYGSPKDILTHEKYAYKGGKTAVFKEKFDKAMNPNKCLYYFDINSSFPSSMIGGDIPFKYLRTVIFGDGKDKLCSHFDNTNKKDIKNYYNYYAKVDYVGKDPNYIANIMERSKEGNITSSKKTTGYDWHWGCELKEAIRNGCIVSVNCCDVYETRDLFTAYVNNYYELKNKYKNSAPSLCAFYKLLLNSLYGKFGQRHFTKTAVCSSADEMYDIIGNNQLLGFDIAGDKIIAEYNVEGDRMKSIGNLVRISSYVTAMSRCKLSEIMRDIGWSHIYYCDTDSIFTDKMPSAKFMDNNILGKWKNELPGENILLAIFTAPKTYYYETDYVKKKLPNGDDDPADEHSSICRKAKGVQAKLLTRQDYIDMQSGKQYQEVCFHGEGRSQFRRSKEGVQLVKVKRTIEKVLDKRIFTNNCSEPFESEFAWKKSKIDNSGLSIEKIRKQNEKLLRDDTERNKERNILFTDVKISETGKEWSTKYNRTLTEKEKNERLELVRLREEKKEIRIRECAIGQDLYKQWSKVYKDILDVDFGKTLDRIKEEYGKPLTLDECRILCSHIKHIQEYMSR